MGSRDGARIHTVGAIRLFGTKVQNQKQAVVKTGKITPTGTEERSLRIIMR